MDSSRDEISRLYEGSKNFLLIGVTGYTGSGCTTFSEILQQDHPPCTSINQTEYIGSDGIKFSKAQKYLSNNDNWTKFYVIKVSHVLTCLLMYLGDVDSLIGSTIKLAEMGSIKDKKDKINQAIAKARKSFKAVRGEFDLFCKMEDYLCQGDKSTLLSDKKRFLSLFKKEDEHCIEDMFLRVKEIHDSLKKDLNNIGDKYYNLFYQYIGVVIRKGIKLKFKNNKLSTNIHTIPSIINKLVKVYRALHQGNPCRIVIESIRNSHEIDYFRERYSAFYMVSINRDEERRIKGLESCEFKMLLNSFERGKLLEFSDDKIEKEMYDKVFSSRDGLKYEELYFPNISNCLQKSDIHLFDDRDVEEHQNLKAQIAWYLSLILHPGLFPPTAMERNMRIAYQAKFNSGCISRQVGAAVTDSDDTILSIGWNEVPKGQISCILRTASGCLQCNEGSDKYSEYEKTDEMFRIKLKSLSDDFPENVKDEFQVSYCFKDIQKETEGKDRGPTHIRALHAEENALLQVGKYGNVKGGKLYTTTCTCALCAKKASAMQISEIIYLDPYTDISMNHELRYKNSPKLTQFRGAIGPNFDRLYAPKLPFKTELNLYRQ